MPCFRFLCSSRQWDEEERSRDSASVAHQAAAANAKRSPDGSIVSHAAAPAAPLHQRCASLQSESSSSSLFSATAKALTLPSRTLSPSQTTTRLQLSQAASSLLQPWTRSRQDSVELVPVSSEPAEAAGAATGRTAEEAKTVSAQSSDAAIKAAFTAPLPTRRLPFPSAPPASIAATIAESSKGDAAAGVTSSPSTDDSISSPSSSSLSPAPPPAPAQLPSRPPPHPHSRRLSNTAAPAPPVPAAAAAAPAVTSRPHSSSMPSSQPLPAPPAFSASQPSTPTSKQPQPLYQTPSPSSASKRPTASSSTPLRARRLQRHRALSSSSPHSSLFPRASYIAASPTLSAFFSSPAAASVMTQRLTTGGIFLHHEAASSCYRHVFANSSLTRLHYVELSAAASSPSLLSSLPAAAAVKLPHVLCSSIIKLSRGLGTRSLIEKQTAMTESGCAVLLPAPQLLSLSTPTVVLDLECCGESERDEWWLTFDWLLWTWNQRRTLAQQAGAAAATAAAAGQKPGSRPAAGAEGRKGSWLGGVVGLSEQQERLLRHDRHRQRRDAISPTSLMLLQAALPSAAAGRPPATADAVSRSGQSRAGDSVSGSGAVSDRELYQLLALYVSDIEKVREANRLLLVEDCASMIDMQRQIDALRDENVAIIEQLRPDSTRVAGCS